MPTFNLADLFESVVDVVPERLALVTGDTRLSYRELDERANRLANYLRSRNIKADDHVAIYAYNRAEWVEAMWACFKIAAVPININYRYVEGELRYIFDNADIKAVIYEAEFEPLIRTIESDLPLLREQIIIDGVAQGDHPAVNYEQALASQHDARPSAERKDDNIYMLYTGGTTGMPKGTLWHHKAIFYGALQGGNPAGEPIKTPEELAEIARANTNPFASLCPAPMMHGGGMWYCMIYQLSGNTFVLYKERSFDPHKLLQLAEQEKVANLIVVGDAMARPLADALANHSYDLSQLFVIGSGGAILSPAVKNQLKKLLPNTLVMDSFGASETGSAGMVMDYDKAESAGPTFTLSETVAILDEDTLEPIPAGSDKRGLLAKSGAIPFGYYKDDSKTAATFKTDARGVRWVIPGDYARVLADGRIELLGRGSMCINSGGEKIYPEEVEACLKAHPAVFDVGVIGVGDEQFGAKVVAVIQLRDSLRANEKELRDFCRTKLAAYKCPREWLFEDKIPRTPVGKPDYRKLKALVEQGLAKA